MQYVYVVSHSYKGEPYLRAVFTSQEKAYAYINSPDRRHDYGIEWRVTGVMLDPEFSELNYALA